MDKLIQNFDSGVDSILQDTIRKPTFIRAIVHLLLILYAVRLAPVPPKAVLDLFDNVYFKLFIFSLVLWTARFSPSTSILIALAFMVTMNYSSTGKLWEMMDNVTPTNALDAVKMLSNAAISPVASSPAVIAPIAQIAASAATTPEGVASIQALAQQSITPVAGTPEKVDKASSIAINSIVGDKTQAMQGLKALSNAALSSASIPAKDVVPVAQIVASAVSTPEAISAVQALAEQAVTAHAGELSKVDNATKIVVDGINNQSGCYPLRNYDMSKVSPQRDGQYSFEDYQQYSA